MHYWERIAPDFWRRKTETRLAHTWQSGQSWRWLVISRHVPGNPNRVLRLGHGEAVLLAVAQSQADEVFDSDRVEDVLQAGAG